MKAFGIILLGVLALVIAFFALKEPVKKGSRESKSLEIKTTPSNWPQYRGHPQAYGVAPGDFPDHPSLIWKSKVGANMVSSPSIYEDQIFIGSGDDKVYSLDRKTGKVIWSFQTEDVIEATPLILQGKVYIGSADYFFYCLDQKTGKMLWKLETDGKVLGSANWAKINDKPVIIMGSYDGFLYALEAESGKVLWKYDSENYVNGTPLVDGEYVYFGGCDEQLHGVEIASGKGVFTHALDAPVPGTASKWQDTLYVGTHGGRFLAFDIKEKKIAWEITDAEDGFYATAAVNDEYLVLAGRDKLLRNLDPKTGKERWSVNMRSAMDSSPLIVGDKVIVGTKGGKCVSLKLDTGEKIWEYDVGSQIIGALSYANDVLYVSVKNGNLYAFGAKP